MAAKVVDASAIAALVFGEPEGAAVAHRLRDSELVAPALLAFEMASICLKKMRGHPQARAVLLDLFADFEHMDVASMAVDQAEVIELARSARLSSYDASYLWLARQLGAELVTLDARLASAATVR